MKGFMCFVFGFSLSAMIMAISPYTWANWQFWAALVPVAIIGFIYGELPRD